MKTYYNLPEVESLEQFVGQTMAHIEESKTELLTQAGIIADGTRGQAADTHAETAQLADQVSEKAMEVTNLLQTATQQARESSIETDVAGAGSLGFGA